jgi:hypothetical protein
MLAGAEAVMAVYVVKAAIADPARTFSFPRMKTMYGGRRIAVGDTVYLFASETQGGKGLIARGLVTAAQAIRKPRGATRWTPRVSITVRRTAKAKRPLGREQLKRFRGLKDGSGEVELDFKFYRQATNKICAVSDKAGRYLRRFF